MILFVEWRNLRDVVSLPSEKEMKQLVDRLPVERNMTWTKITMVTA